MLKLRPKTHHCKLPIDRLWRLLFINSFDLVAGRQAGRQTGRHVGRHCVPRRSLDFEDNGKPDDEED